MGHCATGSHGTMSHLGDRQFKIRSLIFSILLMFYVLHCIYGYVAAPRAGLKTPCGSHCFWRSHANTPAVRTRRGTRAADDPDVLQSPDLPSSAKKSRTRKHSSADEFTNGSSVSTNGADLQPNKISPRFAAKSSSRQRVPQEANGDTPIATPSNGSVASTPAWVVEEDPAVREGEWTVVQKSMFRRGVEIFTPADPCAIAAFVGKPRTCRDIAAYVQSLGLEIPATAPPIEKTHTHSPRSSPTRRSLCAASPSNTTVAVGNEDSAAPKKRKGTHESDDVASVPSTRTASGNSAADLDRNTSGDSAPVAYVPCTHDGLCTAACPCVMNNTPCEKYCKCNHLQTADILCENKFKGCRCHEDGDCDKNTCPCFRAGRECDPDLCTTCGAASFKTRNTSGGSIIPDLHGHTVQQCKNVRVQRRQHKKIKVSPSEVAGWGVFLAEDAKKGDFLAEYCGEVITHDEAERRGKLYDHLHLSFLFNLNRHYVVDSTHKGSKIRFANHSNNPNCLARIIKVAGEHRIGIFAKEDIPSGTELFYNYSYRAADAEKYVPLPRLDTK